MPTGLNIRDFTKVYRELRYDGSGSIRLSEIEHNAYLNRLTIEITHYDANRAQNFKTLPENTHWGYVTSFKGTSVIDSKAVKFARQRVFEHINQAVWNYHQSTENLLLTKAIAEAGSNGVIESTSEPGAIGALINLFINAKDFLGGQIDNAASWLIGKVLLTEAGEQPVTDVYTAFPIASPYPDIFKFKSDIPASFLLRLESWYLVNPSVYITANPSDTSDETEDENEYPMPSPGDNDGGGENFPSESPRDPNSDSRDFTDGSYGSQGTWIVMLNYFDAGNNPPCNQVADRQVNIAGLANSPPVLITTAPPNQTGAPAKSLQTQLQTIPVARDCGVSIIGTPTFLPGQVVFP